eukprot:TRINITY_DN596_c0_g2_i3.p1 TRINITY_DN596_c0_g2~~TRINITY_DN596_c0_g2_i3.p1  ORF type:complete len:839 (+),score=119.52 TRINITY_DN596_c0_g2_i3:51-2567(+)
MPDALLAYFIAGTLCSYPEVLWSDGAVDTVSDVVADPAGEELLYSAAGGSGLVIWNTTVAGQEVVVGRLDSYTGIDALFYCGLWGLISCSATNIAVFGKTVYLGISTPTATWITAIDVRSPERPEFLGTYYVSQGDGVVADIKAGPGVVYMLLKHGLTDGISLLNVSNPQWPVHLTNILLERPTCFDIAGTTLYVSHAEADVAIFDVSNPLAPTVLGSIGRGSGYDVTEICVDGDTAYLGATGNTTLVTVNVTTPAAPARLGAAYYGDHVIAVHAEGPTAYLLLSSLTLLSVDVSTPTAPAELGNVSLGDANRTQGALAKRSASPTLYVVAQSIFLYSQEPASMTTVSVSDPRDMREVGAYSANNAAHDVSVSGDVAYVAREEGLEAYNISDPRAPVKVYGSPGDGAWDTSIDGGHLAVTGKAGGLSVYDISSGRPVRTGVWNSSMASARVKLVGGVAYVLHEDELSIIDVGQMTQIGSFTFQEASGGWGCALDVVGTTAYCACGSVGTMILDVSNSSQPVVLGKIPAIRGDHRGVTVKGDFAYIVTYALAGMLTVDVSDKANPKLLSTYVTPGVSGCYRVTVSGSTAYLSCVYLEIVDVTSAVAPRHITTYQTISYVPETPTYVAGDTLYVANLGLWIYDVTPPRTAVPDAAVPDTGVPVTATPDTAVPGTTVPETGVPETPTPDTAVPDTGAPVTAAPDTPVPDTGAPVTAVPSTTVPKTAVPVTTIPETGVPLTPTPDTAVPDTGVPVTAAPVTAVPATVAPRSTATPQTEAPATAVPKKSDGSSSDVVIVVVVVGSVLAVASFIGLYCYLSKKGSGDINAGRAMDPYTGGQENI